MTLAAFKRLLYAIIDEQKPKSDITSKIITFLNAGQREIALYYPLYKSERYEQNETERLLPQNFYKAVRCYTNEKRAVKYFIENGEIRCEAEPFTLLYEAELTEIDNASPDTYELQTQEEAILALVYYVAAQLYNNEDGTGVFQSYYAQYQGKMQNLTAAPRLCAAVVYEGASNV